MVASKKKLSPWQVSVPITTWGTTRTTLVFTRDTSTPEVTPPAKEATRKRAQAAVEAFKGQPCCVRYAGLCADLAKAHDEHAAAVADVADARAEYELAMTMEVAAVTDRGIVSAEVKARRLANRVEALTGACNAARVECEEAYAAVVRAATATALDAIEAARAEAVEKIEAAVLPLLETVRDTLDARAVLASGAAFPSLDSTLGKVPVAPVAVVASSLPAPRPGRVMFPVT